ncbi:MAG TPA: winged helix-turn-helix domain-containing protein [Candidatus Acidoferrales bacterium]|nr:winged helix-turn-helix domain-containing protein [Candidatus Acidoferrales bacterium]
MAVLNDGRKVKFGIFEADLSAHKLWKRGFPVHLQEKPFLLLGFLLERSGELVTREELRNRLWSDETFVEFDEGVNAAVGKVRYALGDSAEKPVFFETVRGQGYRWIAPVAFVENTDASASAPPQTHSPTVDRSTEFSAGSVQNPTVWSKPLAVKIGLIVAAAALLITVVSYVSRPHPVVHTASIKQRQLTTNSRENPVSANAISPDGKYLAFADMKGLHIKLTTTGEVRDVPNPAPYENSYVDWGIPQNWLPDGTGFIVNTNPPYQPVSTWVVSLLGGPPRKIRDGSSPWSVSAEGKISYTAHPGQKGDREIWLTDADGQNPRKILEVGENSGVSMLVWSPDGRRIGYLTDHNDSALHTTSIDAVDVRTSVPTTLVPSTSLADLSRLPSDLRSLVWLPNGRIIYSTGVSDSNGFSCNYWEVHVNSDSGASATLPNPVTSWAGSCLLNVGATANGNQIVFQRVVGHRKVFIAKFDVASQKLITPKLLRDQEGQEFPTAWAPDGKSVVIASNRDGNWQLLKQRYDAEKSELVASILTAVADQTPLTPDGLSLLNVASDSSDSGGRGQLWRIPLAGGPAEPLLTGRVLGVRCSRASVNLCLFIEESPDHKQFVFSRLDPLRGRGPEETRIDREDITADYEWALSPDGTMIAFAKQFDNEIHLFRVSGGPVRIIHVKGWNLLRNITWTADGRGFFASHPSKRGAVLLLVNMYGVAKVLWELPGHNVYLRAIPSPDKRHVAILGSEIENNVWMMENF